MDELGNALIPLGEIPNMPSDQLRGTLGTLRGLIASLHAEVARGGDGGGALWKYALRQNAAIEKELHERQAKDRIMAMLSGADVPQEDYSAMHAAELAPVPAPAPFPAPAAEPAAPTTLPQPPPANATAPPYASPPARRPRPRTREQQQRREGGAAAVAATATATTPSAESAEVAVAPARPSAFMVPLPSSLQPRDSAQPITTSSPAKAVPPPGAGGSGGAGRGDGEALGSSDEEEEEGDEEEEYGRPMSSASGVRPTSSASVASSSSQRSARERDGERSADPNHWSRRQKTKTSATANWGKGFVIASGGGGCVPVSISVWDSFWPGLRHDCHHHHHHHRHRHRHRHRRPRPHSHLHRKGTGGGAPHRSAWRRRPR